MMATGIIDVAPALAASARRTSSAGTAPKVRQEAIAMVEEDGLAMPAYSYRSTEVRGTGGELLEFGAASICAPGLADVSSRLTAVTAVVCTLGPAIEERVSQLCAGRRLSLALALDRLGNELLMYTARQVMLMVRAEARKQGLSIGDAISPGGRGLQLDQQGTVVALADGARLGVRVIDQGMLHPVKSRSMVIGVGSGLTAKPLRRRCEGCSSRETCSYRAH